jgi:hypothetical protein
MAALRVTFLAAPHDHAVHIEAVDHPHDLLYAAEDIRAASVYHHAWDYIRQHREYSVAAIDQRFGPAMSYARRYRVMRWMYWLLALVLQRQRREPYFKSKW